MRMRMMLAGVVAAGLMALPAMAQDAVPAAAGEGQYGEPLRQMLAEAGQGKCLEALMAPGLLALCNEQIGPMQQMVQTLGAVESMTLVSAQNAAGGRVETWAVKYANGQTLNWYIGARQADGKFASVGTDA